jgi:16S rRNA processing protein RimM
MTVGRVVKPQGRKGEVLVEPLSDRPGRFPGLRQVFLPGAGGGARALRVEACWPHKGRFVLKLEGVGDIDAAERLRDAELRIGEEELDPLPEGSYYHHQLRGLRAVTSAGELGSVAEVLETGAGAAVLVVRGPRGESLLPLAREFVRRVDLAAGRIELVLPETLEC